MNNPQNIKQLKLQLDVPTRWNSQYDMLIRFSNLKEAVTYWFSTAQAEKYRSFQLNTLEWQQVKYLIRLLKPIKVITDHVQKTKTTTVHQTFMLYDKFFNHLEGQEKEAKSISPGLWSLNLKKAIEQGTEKLRKYYSKTWAPYGLFLNLSTVLDCEVKLDLYKV